MIRLNSKNKKDQYDVVVIGGGVSGASVAYEAASRGLSVALFEKDDFGHATSAATSKMIHGGLRYLQKMEFKIVRESLSERRALADIAPNFVYPIPFLLNSYKTDKIPFIVFKMGLMVYDMFAFDKNRLRDDSKKITNHKVLSKKEVLKREPYVKEEGLKKGLMYYDYLNIVPERLTFTFVKSAVACGAQAANYTKVESFITDGKTIKGVEVNDLINDEKYKVHGKMVINCGGPWADIILHQSNLLKDKLHLTRSEGIHLVADKRVYRNVVGASLVNGGHCFLVPWRNRTLIGTSDKEYKGHPDDWKVTKEAVEELLNNANSMFGNNGEQFKPEDIKYVYGGLRPLAESKNKDVYGTSRHYEIYDYQNEDISGLISVTGGKYTTSRGLAQKVVEKIEELQHYNLQKSETRSRYLKGCEIEDINQFFLDKTKAYEDEFSEEQVKFLCTYYGTEVDDVIALSKQNVELKETVDEDGEILAQVVYAIRNEMALTLNDILFRRTGIGTIGHPGKERLKKVATIAAQELGWSEQQLNNELQKAEEKFTIPI